MHFHLDVLQILIGGGVYGVLAYAARTLPTPDGPWGKWAIGVIQFALSNKELGSAAMKAIKANVEEAEGDRK